MPVNKARVARPVAKRTGFPTARRSKFSSASPARVAKRASQFTALRAPQQQTTNLQKNTFPKNTVNRGRTTTGVTPV